MIHSGKAEIEESKRSELDRLEFFSAGGHMNYVGGNTVDGVPQPRYLQLRVDKFCEDVFEATDEWDASIANDANLQAEKAKLIVIHDPGVTIGSIHWG